MVGEEVAGHPGPAVTAPCPGLTISGQTGRACRARRLSWADPRRADLRLCLLGPLEPEGTLDARSGCSTCGETQQLGGLRQTI